MNQEKKPLANKRQVFNSTTTRYNLKEKASGNKDCDRHGCCIVEELKWWTFCLSIVIRTDWCGKGDVKRLGGKCGVDFQRKSRYFSPLALSYAAAVTVKELI